MLFIMCNDSAVDNFFSEMKVAPSKSLRGHLCPVFFLKHNNTTNGQNERNDQDLPV